MLVYRIEHRNIRQGPFQSCDITRELKDKHLIYLYYINIYHHIRLIGNLPVEEAYKLNVLSQFQKIKPLETTRYGCESINCLLSNWCILGEHSRLFFETLYKCGFVLSIYETNNYILLQTQVAFNINDAILIEEKSVLGLYNYASISY